MSSSDYVGNEAHFITLLFLFYLGRVISPGDSSVFVFSFFVNVFCLFCRYCVILIVLFILNVFFFKYWVIDGQIHKFLTKGSVVIIQGGL